MVGEGSTVGDELGCGDAVGGMGVTVGTAVGGGVSVALGAATKRVTVGGIGVVSALTARAVRGARLTMAAARHSKTAQKAAKSKTTRLTWLRGTTLRSNCMGIRV